ncbi:MAG TPA: hypothetical protein VLA12_06010 [Planctomycetaceae bacterium]|nr:hypothetical protein [Planctomycetaceae bacterium]
MPVIEKMIGLNRENYITVGIGARELRISTETERTVCKFSREGMVGALAEPLKQIPQLGQHLPEQVLETITRFPSNGSANNSRSEKIQKSSGRKGLNDELRLSTPAHATLRE